MNWAFFNIFLSCMATSLITVILLAIGKKDSQKNRHDYAHIKLLVYISLLVTFALTISELSTKLLCDNLPQKIGTCFLILNSILCLIIYVNNKQKDTSGKIYFFITALLALSIANIMSTNYLIKIFTSIHWLLLFAAMNFFTTKGGKKAEIALKLYFSSILLIITLVLTCFFFPTGVISGSPAQVSWGLLPIILAGLCLAGIVPFHFSHTDSANGTVEPCAFLLLCNAPIQGGILLSTTKPYWPNSVLNISMDFLIFIIITSGMIVIWLRSIDQRKMRRTITYIAASAGHLFCLALLYGPTQSNQNQTYYFIIFGFLSISLFTLYSAVSLMKPLSNSQQTWEDISGLGRTHHAASFCFMVAAATLAGVPGSVGYFLRLSLIHPLQHSFYFKFMLFLSIALGVTCVLRIFVFLYSKQENQNIRYQNQKSPSIFLYTSTAALILLGLLPFFE